MLINTFKQAEAFLTLHIPKTSDQTFSGESGLKRTKYFLHLLGDPQEKIKVIHVAGTSGKGSTCYLISSILISQGLKVGLHQSPHLTDVRERYQINNKIISEKEFTSYLNKVVPIINAVGKTFHGNLTYFEILVGLAYLIFFEKKVDYAVMETGLGGWYDGTNVVSRFDKLSVLTKIGLDHTAILGKTIEKIALQKAMIINEKSQAISIYQDPKAEKVIREVAKNKQANIIFVNKKNYLEEDSPQDNKLSLIGEYQRENAGLALTAVYYLGLRDGFKLDLNKIKKVFETINFPGRFDVKKIADKVVIFDGAHNPQKMEAFIGSLTKIYPKKKFNFLLAFKKGKDFQNMLKKIVEFAESITLTSFYTENQDMINDSEESKVIGRYLKKIGFDNFEINLSLEKAWKYILTKKEPIVVVGSLYLVGEIFKLIKEK